MRLLTIVFAAFCTCVGLVLLAIRLPPALNRFTSDIIHQAEQEATLAPH